MHDTNSFFISAKVASDCVYFKGDIPCQPHKEKEVKCKCDFYKKRGKRILIIKLGAMGDVLRSTPISEKLREVYKNCEITWLTNYPEIVRKASDVQMKFNEISIVTLMADKFDILYNFDKDKEACAITKLINAGIKKGFILEEGKCTPVDKDAEHKFITGVFDDESKKNAKSYQEEMFEIAGMKFAGEKYAMDFSEKDWNIPEGKIIGLNTGGAERWTSRLWPEENWKNLAVLLKKNGYIPVLLGGEAEHKKNKKIAKEGGVLYMGHHPLKEFASLVKKCNVVVTCVTLGLHIAIAMGRNVILLNNIFNKNEFELYGRGKTIEPSGCRCFYKSKCVYEKSCMYNLKPETVMEAIEGFYNV